ncbi:hypothetical protein COO60DRAFT_1501168 [Scenedesmus sp. NREL 46B-D3]|nr:hypothetical protein COO60DRAFT_1501168 [Scenedesmus sp. NREL 46B-D3]
MAFWAVHGPTGSGQHSRKWQALLLFSEGDLSTASFRDSNAIGYKSQFYSPLILFICLRDIRRTTGAGQQAAAAAAAAIAVLATLMHSSLRSRVSFLRIQPFQRSSYVNSPLAARSQQQQHRQLASSSMSALLHGDTFFLDNFAVRQWDDPNYSGTRIKYDKVEFIEKVHQLFRDQGGKLVDGYAPFCKHVFVRNFVGAKLGALAITPENRQLLRCAYTHRRPEELAVLTRWFPESAVQPVPEAQHLDIILYSREQLLQEYADMPSKAGGGGAEPEQLLPNVPWGIISIKAQDEPYETPMQPITIMRNALGREEGGSGVTLDKQAYEASVAYWQGRAAIVAGEEPSGE